jgi:hypothetical protein
MYLAKVLHDWNNLIIIQLDRNFLAFTELVGPDRVTLVNGPLLRASSKNMKWDQLQ